MSQAKSSSRDASPVRKQKQAEEVESISDSDDESSEEKESSEDSNRVGLCPLYVVSLKVFETKLGHQVRKKKSYYGKKSWARAKTARYRDNFHTTNERFTDIDTVEYTYKCRATHQDYKIRVKLTESKVLL